ncbi:MAG: GNAT family N-acetyltransferase [Bacteroidales bacterium]|nr:GNAT family N-acetyltransferase [Bacteroidales bacterium]
MITIKHITIRELPEWIESEEYRALDYLPISRHRALSHYNNPRADKNDTSLFLAFDGLLFIGYLGALADLLFLNNVEKKVAWLSCMWIRKEYRRKGIAQKLLQYAMKEWHGNLLITNFIPSSKATFDKTGQYQSFRVQDGLRAYLRFDIVEILIAKKPALKKIRYLLTSVNFILNVFNDLRLQFYKNQFTLKKLHLEYLDTIDAETDKFIQNHQQNHLTLKNNTDFNWLKKYPWIIPEDDGNNYQKRYAFSAIDKSFEQFFVKVFGPDKNLIAFLILTIRKNHLKTPFLYFDPIHTDQVWNVLFYFLKKNNIRTFTTFHPVLTKTIHKNKNPFIVVRKFSLKSIISKTLARELGNMDGFTLMDGDGDCAFT